jgi:hypothetical protein
MRRVAIALPVIMLLMVLLAPAPALAKDEVIVEVISIAASSGDEDAESGGEAFVDPKLSGYAKKLRALFAYTKYTFLASGRTETDFGSPCTFQLPERFSLIVEPERMEESEGRIEMMVTLVHEVEGERGEAHREREEGRQGGRQEIVLRTKIRLGNGGTVLLGGPPIEGGVLILALSARG